MKLVVESGHSRFPVHGEDKDEILGILLAKDLLRGVVADDGPGSVRELLRPAVLIPESKRLNVLLREFRLSRNHMAIVIDEHGGVAGLVTIEDVLEQIVGEIDDEHDDAEDPNALIAAQADGQFVVDALTPIADFNERFGADFADDEYDTIGGLVTAAIGHLPEAGEELTLGRFHFRVGRADARRVHAFLRQRACAMRSARARRRGGCWLACTAARAAARRWRLRAGLAPAAPRIGVLTMEPGEIFWERFGHNAILVDDPAAGARDLVQLRLLRPDRSRTSSATSCAATCATSWSALPLSRRPGAVPRRRPRRRRAVARPRRRRRRARSPRALAENAQPENARYRYDYFIDNCSHARARRARPRARRRAAQAARGPLARPHLPQRSRCAWPRRRSGCGFGFDVGLGPASPTSRCRCGTRPSSRCACANRLREAKRADGRPLVLSRAASCCRTASLPAGGGAALARGRPCSPAWRWRSALPLARPPPRRALLAALALPFWLLSPALAGALMLFIWFGTRALAPATANHNLLLLSPLAWRCCPARWRVRARPRRRRARSASLLWTSPALRRGRRLPAVPALPPAAERRLGAAAAAAALWRWRARLSRRGVELAARRARWR